MEGKKRLGKEAEHEQRDLLNNSAKGVDDKKAEDKAEGTIEGALGKAKDVVREAPKKIEPKTS